MLEVFIIFSLEIGSEYNFEKRNKMSDIDYKLEALTRLHSRSCLITREIVSLLKEGFSSAAHSRWRTLHETTVVSLFINSTSQETAKKYIQHQVIESYKAIKQYQDYHDRLGYEPFSQEKINELKEKRDQLIEKYGNNYKNNYGWAATEIENNNPTFFDIERYVGLDHLRPYYKMSSHFVHANPKGIYFNLEVDQNQNEVLVAGPSDYGLADPGQCTAISLLQINTALLTYQPNTTSLFVIKMFQKLEEEICREFIKVNKKFENK